MKKTISLTLVFLACWLNISAKDISLVKHASRPETETAQRYTVKGGDTLWKIFMNVYGARAKDMSGLYDRFRILNPEIKNLNHINKGQRILVPRLSPRLLVICMDPPPPVSRSQSHLISSIPSLSFPLSSTEPVPSVVEGSESYRFINQ